MAVLDSTDRDKLAKSEFGMPGERKYPMPDKEHAGQAKARATQQAEKGNLSAAELKKIRAKADAILTRGKLKKAKAPPPPPADTDMDKDAMSDTDADGM